MWTVARLPDIGSVYGLFPVVDSVVHSSGDQSAVSTALWSKRSPASPCRILSLSSIHCLREPPSVHCNWTGLTNDQVYFLGFSKLSRCNRGRFSRSEIVFSGDSIPFGCNGRGLPSNRSLVSADLKSVRCNRRKFSSSDDLFSGDLISGSCKRGGVSSRNLLFSGVSYSFVYSIRGLRGRDTIFSGYSNSTICNKGVLSGSYVLFVDCNSFQRIRKCRSGGIISLSGVSKSVRCNSETKTSWGRNTRRRDPDRLSSIRDKYEKLWRDLLSNPSQWWDNRDEKPNSRFPDFKHKQTGQGLWVIDMRNPSWVALEIGAIPPGLGVLSWSERLAKFNKAGQYEKTLECFEQMQDEGITLDRHMFVHVLNACAGLQDLEIGSRIHKQTIEVNCELNPNVSSSLVDMYVKCGNLDKAQRVFERMPKRTVVSWNALIKGFGKSGQGLKSLELFKEMQLEGVEPNSFTFIGVLNACASIGALEQGRVIHEQIMTRGDLSFGSEGNCDVHVGNSLVDMYAKCGRIDDAWRVFRDMATRDVVGWNSMIKGCAKMGLGLKSLEIFHQMQKEGFRPNSITFVGLLNACASVGALEEGRSLHEHIIQSGFGTDVYVGNSLVDMYAKCGSIEDAWGVFNKMPKHNVIGWNGMISGCVKSGYSLFALKLFRRMQREGIDPDFITFLGALNACASISALEAGRRVHEQIIGSGCESDVYLCSSLVDMYSKCGSIDEAQRVFDNIPGCDVVCWNAMIMGYAIHGLAKEAVALFEQMVQAGSKIDEVTFICLLSACSHGGLVKEALRYFESMGSVYGVPATEDHYTCMVDVLGRAGHLDEAEDMLNSMPLEPFAASWVSLLCACKIHGNVEIGERASKKILELDSTNDVGNVLLSTINGATCQWDDKSMLHQRRWKKRIMKQPGCAWIEVNNEIHSFVGNRSQHCNMLEIHEFNRLLEQTKGSVYNPNMRFKAYEVEDEKQSVNLCCHIEKLAIAFGLISTPAGTPLRIAKNLRVCGDCHTSTKLLSMTVGRAISVRDVRRFHHFKDGVCSCGDYW